MKRQTEHERNLAIFLQSKYERLQKIEHAISTANVAELNKLLNEYPLDLQKDFDQAFICNAMYLYLEGLPTKGGENEERELQDLQPTKDRLAIIQLLLFYGADPVYRHGQKYNPEIRTNFDRLILAGNKAYEKNDRGHVDALFNMLRNAATRYQEFQKKQEDINNKINDQRGLLIRVKKDLTNLKNSEKEIAEKIPALSNEILDKIKSFSDENRRFVNPDGTLTENWKSIANNSKLSKEDQKVIVLAHTLALLNAEKIRAQNNDAPSIQALIEKRAELTKAKTTYSDWDSGIAWRSQSTKKLVENIEAICKTREDIRLNAPRADQASTTAVNTLQQLIMQQWQPGNNYPHNCYHEKYKLDIDFTLAQIKENLRVVEHRFSTNPTEDDMLLRNYLLSARDFLTNLNKVDLPNLAKSACDFYEFACALHSNPNVNLDFNFANTFYLIDGICNDIGSNQYRFGVLPAALQTTTAAAHSTGSIPMTSIVTQPGAEKAQRAQVNTASNTESDPRPTK